MTILHAHNAPHSTAHLRAILADANGQTHSVDIAVGYFYLSGFALVADLLATRPGKVRNSIRPFERLTKNAASAGRINPVSANPIKNRGLARPRSPCAGKAHACLAAPAHSRSAGATSSAYSRIDRCTRSAGTVPPKLGSIIKPVSPRSARMLFRRSATISGVPYATRSASRSS